MQWIDVCAARTRRTSRFVLAVFFFVVASWVASSAMAQETLAVPDRIVAATREVPPFAMQNEVGEWTGISIDLLREVKAEFESNSQQEIALEFRALGLDELLEAVEKGDVDLAAGAITVNYEREKRMDFTHPFYSSGLGIAVGASQRAGDWSGVFSAVISPTFLSIIGGLLGAMFASAVAVYFFERRGNREQFGGGAIRGISSGLWWAAVTLTTVGYGDKVPRTVAGKMIGLVWMFAGLFIIASFTASVTSALTVTQLKSRINGPADLSRVKVATVEGSTSERYLRARHIVFNTYSDAAAALTALEAEDCDAVVYDAPVLRYQVYQRFAGDLFVLPVTFERQDYAFALPSGSPLREPINQVLLRVTSSPEWEEVLAGYLGEQSEQ